MPEIGYIVEKYSIAPLFFEVSRDTLKTAMLFYSLNEVSVFPYVTCIIKK